MSVSVKVYYGRTSGSANEIRRFIFKPEYVPKNSTSLMHSQSPGIYAALIDRIQLLFHGLNFGNVHLCWKDDDGDYVVFSSDDELKVAINSTTDNTLRIYIREKDSQVKKPQAAINSGQQHHHRPTARVVDEYSTIAKKSVHRHHSRSRERDHGAPFAGHYHGGTNGGTTTIGANMNIVTLKHLAATPETEYCDMNSADIIARYGHLDLVGLGNNNVDGHDSATGTGSTVTSSLASSSFNHDGIRESLPSSSSSAASTSPPITVISKASPVTPKSATSQILCYECHGNTRRGVWYKCTTCVDYFLCTDCENRGIHDKHSMIRTVAHHQELLVNGGIIDVHQSSGGSNIEKRINLH